MDNFETESNCSYHSESLQSNASTVSGLSLYGNEFAELRHLVNPSKYPQPYLEPSILTLKVDEDDNKVKALRNKLQGSLELNEKYKLELRNVERKIELKFCDRINKLLGSNSRLKGELENANNQIDRLIKGYDVCKENVDLEKKLQQLNLECYTLETKYAKLQQDKTEIDLENKHLKISLDELLIERDIRNSSVQSLKQKVSEQHIEILEFIRNNSHLNEKLNLANTKHAESEKSKLWYKEQLSICQNDKLKLNEELAKCINQISNDNEKILNANIELSKYKNEVDNVRLQALKEKEELLKELESINNLRHGLEHKCDFDTLYTFDTQFYEQTIADLKDDVSKLNKIIVNKSNEIEKLTHENSRVISNCLVLQSTLKQKEDSIHLLETSRKELLQNVEFLKDSEQQKLSEILQLKNQVAKLEVELKVGNKEKDDVEGSIRLIREQFLQVKGNYEKVKSELNSKNQEIVKLQLEKQEMFMNNSRITCELDSFKHKDSLIEKLRNDNGHLNSTIETLAETQILQKQETIIDKKGAIVSDCSSQLIDQKNLMSTYCETQISEYEDEIRHLQGKLDKLQNAFDHVKLQIAKKDEKINEMLKTIEEQQKNVQNLSISHENKDKCISVLQNKLRQFETDWQNYLRRITDDQKVELLSSHKNIHYTSEMDNNSLKTKHIENYIMNYFDNLNVEEFQSSVDVRLKYLEDRIRKIMGNVTFLRDKSRQNKIRELNIILQVKDRELQDKQKKMDRNNRLLLRKVKEHMRGRNSAEKQLKCLQELYDRLAIDNNSKEHEIRSLVEFCEVYKKEIESLRNKTKNCVNCIELGQIQDKLESFEALCQELQVRNGGLQEELSLIQGNLNSLQEEHEALEVKNESLQQQISILLKENEENKASKAMLRDLERDNSVQVKNLENQLFEKEDLCCKQSELIEKLKGDLVEATEKTNILSNEVQIHSSNLQPKVDYLQELEGKIRKLEAQSLENDATYNKTVCLLQNDIKTLKNKTFFLQRLSSDLKVAMNSYMEHNKKLKQQLSVFTSEKPTFNRLPDNLLNNISMAGKYDENYINRLLNGNNRSLAERNLVSVEIQKCLSKLREEIFSLHDQISKKNGVGHVEVG